MSKFKLDKVIILSKQLIENRDFDLNEESLDKIREVAYTSRNTALVNNYMEILYLYFTFTNDIEKKNALTEEILGLYQTFENNQNEDFLHLYAIALDAVISTLDTKYFFKFDSLYNNFSEDVVVITHYANALYCLLLENNSLETFDKIEKLYLRHQEKQIQLIYSKSLVLLSAYFDLNIAISSFVKINNLFESGGCSVSHLFSVLANLIDKQNPEDAKDNLRHLDFLYENNPSLNCAVKYSRTLMILSTKQAKSQAISTIKKIEDIYDSYKGTDIKDILKTAYYIYNSRLF